MTNNQDTYIAENDQVGDLVAYFCAALLMHWSAELKALDFQGIIVFLQSLPTDNWTLVEVRKLLPTAFSVPKVLTMPHPHTYFSWKPSSHRHTSGGSFIKTGEVE